MTAHINTAVGAEPVTARPGTQWRVPKDAVRCWCCRAPLVACPGTLLVVRGRVNRPDRHGNEGFAGSSPAEDFIGRHGGGMWHNDSHGPVQRIKLGTAFKYFCARINYSRVYPIDNILIITG